MKTKFLTFIILGAMIVVVIIVWRSDGKEVNADVADLAACLASKNITMYGADWCPHCQNEKKAFGEAFKQIPYVECPDNPQKCIDAGIKGYPTWVWPDPSTDSTSSPQAGSGQVGKRLEGEQGIEKLAKESGCGHN